MKLENFVLVFCNGEPPSRERIEELLPHPRLIACADGGANKAVSLGYEPNLVIGDLDSFVNDNQKLQKAEIIKINSQDNTDFEKTLDFLLDRGLNQFLVVAFSGGRIDQTLANLQIAYEYSKKCKIVLADSQYMVCPVRDSLISDAGRGLVVSLIPMEDGTRVSTDGLKYKLNHVLLRKGGRGVSNESTMDNIQVTIHEGGVLVFLGSADKVDPPRK